MLDRARSGDGASKGFSRAQQFVAALYWFATLPLEARLEMVRRFGADCVTPSPTVED
jgi:hypothetical protein